jgi:hypothetical protein
MNGAPSRTPHAAPLRNLPWQFAIRAAAIATGLTLLLIIDVRGVAFYVAWGLIAFALVTEAAATLVHWRRSQGRT